MENIHLYNTTEEYNSDKNNLLKLDYFIGYDAEKDKVYFKSTPTYYILVSTSNLKATLLKYINQEGTETEEIIIPAGSNNYKVDGLMYGFSTKYEGRTIPITHIDLSNLNTSNVINMEGMFIGLGDISSLDLSNFDTLNITNMSGMFGYCSSLTSLDLNNFDTSKVTDMGALFAGCTSLTSLDLSNFDTSNVTTMSNMFSGCNQLNHIKCKQAFKDWCWANQSTVALPDQMKYGGGKGTWEIVD